HLPRLYFHATDSMPLLLCALYMILPRLRFDEDVGDDRKLLFDLAFKASDRAFHICKIGSVAEIEAERDKDVAGSEMYSLQIVQTKHRRLLQRHCADCLGRRAGR